MDGRSKYVPFFNVLVVNYVANQPSSISGGDEVVLIDSVEFQYKIYIK